MQDCKVSFRVSGAIARTLCHPPRPPWSRRRWHRGEQNHGSVQDFPKRLARIAVLKTSEDMVLWSSLCQRLPSTLGCSDERWWRRCEASHMFCYLGFPGREIHPVCVLSKVILWNSHPRQGKASLAFGLQGREQPTSQRLQCHCSIFNDSTVPCFGQSVSLAVGVAVPGGLCCSWVPAGRGSVTVLCASQCDVLCSPSVKGKCAEQLCSHCPSLISIMADPGMLLLSLFV